MRERLAWIAVALATAIVAFWLGRDSASSRDTKAAVAGAIPEAESEPVSAPVAVDAVTPPADAAATAAPAPASREPADAALLDQQRRAAEDVVANAMALGRWTDRDADVLLAATSSLPASEQLEFQKRIARAINEDRLRLVKGARP